MERFGLDTVQTDAILELRLQSLVRLEENKLRQEMAERRKRLAEIDRILASDALIWQEVRQELLAIRQRYGDARRTELIQSAPEPRFSAEDFVEHEDIWIVLTRMGRIKRLKSYDPDTVLLRDDDRVLTAFPASTRDRVAFFSNFGRVYIVPAFDLPAAAKGYGEPIQTVFSFQDGERAVAGMALTREGGGVAGQIPETARTEAVIAAATMAEGTGAVDAEVKTISARPRTPTVIRQLGLFPVAHPDRNEETAAPECDKPVLPSGPDLMLITRSGKGLRLPTATLAETTIRAGRQVMKMEPGDELIEVLAGEAPLLLLASQKRVMVLKREEVALLTGPGKGVKLMTVDPAGIHTVLALSPQDQVRIVSQTGRSQDYPQHYFLALWRGGKGRIVKGGIDQVELVPAETG